MYLLFVLHCPTVSPEKKKMFLLTPLEAINRRTSWVCIFYHKSILSLDLFGILLNNNVVLFSHQQQNFFGSSRPEVFLQKGVLKIWSKFTGEHPCRSATSIKSFCKFIEIALRHGCSPENLLHIFRTTFPKNTSGRLLLISLTLLLEKSK